MKRVITTCISAVLLAGLAACGGEAEDTAQAPEPAAASVPTSDDERVCRAVAADLSVGEKRLDDVTGKAEAARVRAVVDDLEERLERYPAVGADLKAAVQEVADLYAAAADKLGDEEAFAAEVVKLRAAQTKLLETCA